MYELVFAFPGATWAKPAKLIYHECCRAWAYPDIAIDYPHDITLGFSVRPTHIADLWVRTHAIVFSAISIGAHQIRILLFHVNFRIEAGEVPEQTPEDWVRWIIACGNAEVNCQLLRWVVLLEGSSQTFVKVGLDAFYRPNNGNMRNVRKREEARYWLRWRSRV